MTDLKRLGLIVIVMVMVIVGMAAPVLAAEPTPKTGLRPDCNPTLPPSAESGGTPETTPCNISAFTVWVQKIIKWLFWISMPLALIFGIYGGFVIMTAGGAEERFKHGKSILTAAIIGLLIVFLSNLIVSSIVKILTKGEL